RWFLAIGGDDDGQRGGVAGGGGATPTVTYDCGGVVLLG
ncbi:hypothetical protein Tco_1012838, partial [Tanacetum coccineum]